MYRHPLLPNTTPPFRDGDNLVGHLLREHVLPATHGPFPARGVQDPHDRRSPPLSLIEWLRDLQSHTAARGALLVADAHQGGDGVDCQGEVLDGIEW